MSSKLTVGLVSAAVASGLTMIYSVAGREGVRDVVRPAVDIPFEVGSLVAERTPLRVGGAPAPAAPAVPATTLPLPTEKAQP